MVRFVFKITEITMHFHLNTDCAETPFQHILPRSKLARDLKDVFKRFAHLIRHCMYVFWFCDWQMSAHIILVSGHSLLCLSECRCWKDD